jgi:hypothetical protein
VGVRLALDASCIIVARGGGGVFGGYLLAVPEIARPLLSNEAVFTRDLRHSEYIAAEARYTADLLIATSNQHAASVRLRPWADCNRAAATPGVRVLDYATK